MPQRGRRRLLTAALLLLLQGCAALQFDLGGGKTKVRRQHCSYRSASR
jgi:hypothetical protein